MAEVLKTNNMKKESAFQLRSGNKPSPAELSGISPMKNDKKKKTYKIENGERPKTPEKPATTEITKGETETLIKSGYYDSDISKKKSAKTVAAESVVIPEIEIKAKKRKKRYTKKDLANTKTREQRAAIMYHARKNKYKIK